MLLPKSMVAARRLATATVTQKRDFYDNPGVVDDTLLVQNGNTDNCVVQQKKSLNPAAVELFKGESKKYVSKKYVYLVPSSAAKCGCEKSFCPPYIAMGASLLVQARINEGNAKSTEWQQSMTRRPYSSFPRPPPPTLSRMNHHQLYPA